MMDVIVFILGFVISVIGGAFGGFILTLLGLACVGKCTAADIKADENNGLVWFMAIHFFIICFYATTYFLIRSHYVGR